MTSLLFVYGTLMRGYSLHHLLEGRAEYVGPGQVEGRLFDLGAYPAAVRDPGGTITGEVYRVVGSALWTALDSAEGPQYHREEVTVRIGGGGEVVASIYWYRDARRGAPIPGGDYRAHAPAVSIYHDPRA